MTQHHGPELATLPQDPLATLGAWFHDRLPPGATAGNGVPCLIVLIVVIGLALLGWTWSNRNNTAGRMRELTAVAEHHGGMATPAMIRRVASRTAMRKQAPVLLPRLRDASRKELSRLPVTEYATCLAKVGRCEVWSPIEDVTLRIGGPRTGKTGELAGRILDAPGAVIATSTRTDLIALTSTCRAGRGSVYVFNPAGFAGHASTIGFDPLAGCRDVGVAADRAEDLLGAVRSPGEAADRDFWAGQARRALAALLHAAALGDLTMREVQSWFSDPDAAAPTISRLLRRSDQVAMSNDAAQFLTTNDRTRSSICATVMPALGWLSSEAAVASTLGPAFDIESLLRDRATVYLLGAEDGKVAPLLAALTGHVAREARRIAGTLPGGRLDPPLTLALDEAALICPIPLDNWTADMGGRNVTIHIAVQSRAQLRQRWGDTGAAAILNNAATVLIFGGTRDRDDLQAWSVLAGERLEKVVSRDGSGRVASTSTRRVPVLSPSQIAQLPAGHVLITRRGMPPALGIVQMAWERADVRAAQRRNRDAVPRAQALPSMAPVGSAL